MSKPAHGSHRPGTSGRGRSRRDPGRGCRPRAPPAHREGRGAWASPPGAAWRPGARETPPRLAEVLSEQVPQCLLQSQSLMVCALHGLQHSLPGVMFNEASISLLSKRPCKCSYCVSSALGAANVPHENQARARREGVLPQGRLRRLPWAERTPAPQPSE